MRRIWAVVVRGVAVVSFLVSGTVVVLWLRTFDGRWNWGDGVTDSGMHWRVISWREGMLFAWARPWPARPVVRWREAGDLTPPMILESDLLRAYWLEEGTPAWTARDPGPSMHRGWGYVYWGGGDGPVGKVRWVRVHAPHGLVAGITAIPAGVVGARAALKWDRRRKRRRSGLCVACGYDLRCCAARCPECGAGRGGEEIESGVSR